MNSIEEYKTLRDEIGRNQNLMAKTMQTGVAISSGVVASSFFSEEYGWVLVFVPTLFMIPIVMHIANLCRKSWIIGRYIEFCLEPDLNICWEAFSREFFGDPNKKSHSKYSLTTVLPLLTVQICTPLFALIKWDKVNGILWVSFFTISLVFVILEFVYLKNFSLRPQTLRRIKATIELMKKSSCETKNISQSTIS